jgi:hypothetical protein
MYQSDVAPLRRVLLAHARDALQGPARISEQWRQLNYLGAPDFDEACRESDAFAALLERLGIPVAGAVEPARGDSLDAAVGSTLILR